MFKKMQGYKTASVDFARSDLSFLQPVILHVQWEVGDVSAVATATESKTEERIVVAFLSFQNFILTEIRSAGRLHLSAPRRVERSKLPFGNNKRDGMRQKGTAP